MPERINRAWMDEPLKPAAKDAGWRKQEARLPSLQPGGRQQKGSGNVRGASRKGDSIGDLFLVEAKTTEKAALRLERTWLEGIKQQAEAVHLRPALAFGFDAGAGREREDWLGFPLELAELLIAVYAAVRDGKQDEAVRLAELVERRASGP